MRRERSEWRGLRLSATPSRGGGGGAEEAGGGGRRPGLRGGGLVGWAQAVEGCAGVGVVSDVFPPLAAAGDPSARTLKPRPAYLSFSAKTM